MHFNYKAIIFIIVFGITGFTLMQKTRAEENYQDLNFPTFEPAGWVFSIIWILLYSSYIYLWGAFEHNTASHALFVVSILLDMSWLFTYYVAVRQESQELIDLVRINYKFNYFNFFMFSNLLCS